MAVASEKSAPTGPVPTNGEKKSRRQHNSRVFRFADRFDWFLNGTSFVCSIASGATMPLMTVVFGQFTSKFSDFASGTADLDAFRDTATTFVLWFIYLFVGKFVLTYVAAITITIAGIRTTRVLRQAFLEHLLRTEIWRFDTPNIGSPATQITTNVTHINQGIAEKLALLVQALAMFFSSFIVALSVQWKLALITMSVIPLFLAVLGVCMALDVPIEPEVTGAYSRGDAFAQEVLSSIRTVYAFWTQDKMTTRYDEYLREAHEHGKKKSIIYGVMGASSYFFLYSGRALAFWQGFHMFQSGEIDSVGKVFTQDTSCPFSLAVLTWAAGRVCSVVLSVVLASSSVGLLFPQIPAIVNAAAAASELFAVFDKPSCLDPLSGAGETPALCNGRIQLENVCFSYPSRPTTQVLRNLGITIPAGKTTAIVGASGSGKSTVVGLLEPWYVPSEGRILLDGREVALLNVKWLRTQMALIQQEPVLFRGTIFHNVAKGFSERQRSLSAAEQRKLVQEACEASYAHDFIQNLAKGCDTYLGERGGTLSGGQKQRIAIAHSIVSNLKILLLDEATSALDPTAEKLVQKALSRVSEGRTTIAIANPLSTIKDADKIVVMGDGQVVEQGTHEQHLTLDRHYARLIKAQRLDVPEDTLQIIDPATEECQSVVNRVKTSRDSIRTSECGTNNLAQDGTHLSKEQSLFMNLVTIVGKQRALFPLIAVAVFACFIAAGTWPGQAVLFSKLIMVFFTSEPSVSEANLFALIFFVIVLGNLLAYFFISVIANVVLQTIGHQYRLELSDRIIRMDINFFNRPENASGALASVLSSVPTNLQELLPVNIFVLLIMTINLVASSCLALVMVFAGLPPLLASGYIKVRLESRLNESNEVRFRESASLASEAVSALRTVAALASEADFLQEYTEGLGRIVSESIKPLSLIMIPYGLSQSVDFLIMALGFWYGSRLMASGEYTAEQFFLIPMGVLFAGQAAAQLFAASGSLTRARGAANHLLQTRAKSPVVQETTENRDKRPGFE
ncbi:hypothetical protein ACJ41O_009971 [Fusarium nematophilum]